MDGNILVTYASKYGATREIAQKIGDVLRQSGMYVDVLPVESVRGLQRYEAVILGSAIYIGKWQKEAVEFLQANEQTLAARPVWLFSSGPTGTGNAVELLEGWRLPAVLQPVVDHIRPRDITVFHGYINPHKLDPITKLMLKGMKKPFGDFRDWNAVAAWAAAIAEALKNPELV